MAYYLGMSLETQSISYLVLVLICLLLLFSRKVMGNNLWRATMTPLASIIGSGFLIAAPLLNKLSGDKAPYLMAILCLISFGIGEVIRWNIKNVEPLMDKGSASSSLAWSERLGEWVLTGAYTLSITYYLYLFSSFFLRMMGHSTELMEKVLVTFIICAIAFFGHQNGLNSLERIESLSVNLKLSIIITFLTALAVFNFTHASGSSPIEHHFDYESFAVSIGLLIMVQGFETSRYLGEKYETQTRIKSMRFAQILSTAIYILMIFLFIPVFDTHPLKGEISETSVIDIGKFVFTLAPMFLFTAAMASQLSAAVADMGGNGGLISEITHKKIKPSQAYVIIATFCITIVWLFDIFSVISFASKAFALYYFFQCLSSVFFYAKKSLLRMSFSALMALVCLCIVIIGKSFE